MKKCFFLFFTLLVFRLHSPAQSNTRRVIHIPDIPAYLSLVFDFHMHTVFADGEVWPSFRVAEAWQEGNADIRIPFRGTNLFTGPDENLEVTLDMQVRFLPEI